MSLINYVSSNRTLLTQTAVSGVVKLASAFSMFFMTLLVTRSLVPEQSGLFLYALSILTVLSTFFRLGLDHVVLRMISSSKKRGESGGTMATGLYWIVISSFPFACLVFLFSEEIAVYVFSKPKFEPVLAISIWALPIMSCYMLLSQGFQAVQRIVMATIFQNLGVSFLFLVSFSLLFSYGALDLTGVFIAKLYLVCVFVMFLSSLLIWHRQIRGRWGKLNFKNKNLWHSSSNLWVATSLTLVVHWSAMLIAGIFVSATELAYFAAAFRVTSLITFALSIVNLVVAPRYAKLWSEGKVKEVEVLARYSIRGTMLIVLPVVLVIYFCSDLIMGMFGEGFEAGAILLCILAIGQFINAATGSVGYLLNMTGHERDVRRMTFFIGPLTIMLSYFLIQWLGVLGAAIATSVGLALQNLGLLFFVKKRLGFWSFF